jgi:hypothetical protein
LLSYDAAPVAMQSVVTTFISIVIAAFFTSALRQVWGFNVASVLCVLMIGLFGVMPKLVEHLTTAKQDNSTKRAIRKFLEAFAGVLGHPDRHVRANIMLFCDDRTRRYVDRETAFNMSNDPDIDLEIGAEAGASGEAVVTRRVTVGDLTVVSLPNGPTWGLTPSELAKVRPTLRSVAAAPITNPYDPEGPLLGTLGIDSDQTIEDAGFNAPQLQAVLQSLADALSILLAKR